MNETEPAPAQEHRRRAMPIVVAVIVVAILALGVWLAARPAPAQLQGMVDADQVNVATKALARVDRLLAEEGQQVRAGQLLATLSSPEISSGERQAQAALQSAQALDAMARQGARAEDVASARSAWLAAQAAANLAAVSSRRADVLYAQGVIAAQRRDEAHAARDSGARQAEALRQQYLKAAAGARPEEKQVARSQVEAAQAGVATANALQAETRLIAPITGEVARRLAEPGEIVGPAVPVFQVVDTAHPWVSVNIREDQFNALRIGSVLKGSVPALGDRTAAFRVYYISPQGAFATWRATRQSAGYDVRSFEVRLRPVRPIPALRPGMSVLFGWP